MPSVRFPWPRRWGSGRGPQVLILILCSIVLLHRVVFMTTDDYQVSREDPCNCSFDGSHYDFCYSLPQNGSIRGRPFDCSYAEILSHLGFFNTSRFLDLRTDALPKAAMVTAFSLDHYEEGIRLIALVRQFAPRQLVVVYDLGLNEKQREHIGSLCQVEYRLFDFRLYGERVKQLHEFRWKALIIAETLRDFGAIWYMDSSVKLKKADLSHVYKLLTCKNGRKEFFNSSVPSIAKRDRREKITEHESGWDRETWRANLRECAKASYVLHGYTGHGIYAATHPDVYKYFPTNFLEIKKPKAKMYEAGFVFAVRTKEVMEDIVKWYVLCSLQPDCMVPTAKLSMTCNFEKGRFRAYAGCHRYDQSIVNLLLANAYYYDRHYYVSEIVDFFNIDRMPGRRILDAELLCNRTAVSG